jgi:hypothetical protein
VSALADERTPSAADRLENPEAFLSRGDLRELGLTRVTIDAIFRACPVVALTKGKPYVRVRDYLALIESHTYDDDKVRPC